MRKLLMAAAFATILPSIANAGACDGIPDGYTCGVPNYSNGEGPNGCHQFQIGGPDGNHTIYYLFSGDPWFVSSRNKLDMAVNSQPITFELNRIPPSGAGGCSNAGVYIRQISIGHKY